MKRLAIVIMTMTFVASGCIVTSINPLYTKGDLVMNNLLVGEWIGKKALLTIQNQNDNSYLINYKDCEDPYNAPENYASCTMADFSVHLLKLGDDYFMDFYPRSYMNSDNLFLGLHIRPAHSFAKIIIEKDSLKILLFDYSWMANYLENNKGKPDYIVADDLITLTASTKELQEFVLKHQKEPGFFSDPIVLVRKNKQLISSPVNER